MADKKIAFQVEIQNIEKVTKLKEELKKLRKQNRELEKDTAKNTKAGKFAAAQYDKNAKAIGDKSKKLRDLNKAIKTNTTDTGKATKSNNGMAKQFLKASAAIGIVVGAFRAVNRIASTVISTFTEFEFVMAKVLAVSGATDEEFEALTATAEELGRTTFFTAKQVGDLQLAYSKLGFTAKEIQDAVKPTLNLATATGTDLARAAQVAGAAVRGFGLDASETERVVDVMAVSFSSSAMDIEKWQTSMTKVAPIAKSAGFSIEDTAAIMSKLTDSGIEASIAGTSLRNILLKMQDPTSDLTKSFGRTIHGLDQLIPAMKKFVAEGGSMADVMEVVDLRQAAAFEQMLTSAESVEILRDEMLMANGEGQRMADIVGDTLQGAFLKLTSALQGLSISLIEQFSGGLQAAIEKAATFINKLTKSAETIGKVVSALVQLIKFLGIYKGIQIATTAATVAFTAALGGASIATLRLMARTKALFAVMRAHPFAMVGTVLIALASDLFKLRHEVEENTESWEKMNEEIFGDIKNYEKRQEIIAALKSEFATLQDVQRAKMNLNKLDEEIAQKEKNRADFRKQLELNAQDLFREGEDFAKEGYINFEMRMYEEGILLKKKQREEMKTARAIAMKNLKIKEGTEYTEESNAAKIKSKQLTASEMQELRDYVEIMSQVVNGTKDRKEAEKELIDLTIQRLESQLNEIPLMLIDSEQQYLELQKEIIDLKKKRMSIEDKSSKKELKNARKLIREYSSLGGALQTIAGDSEELNGIRQAGEAITRAAAVAEAILTLNTTAQALAKGELNLATLLGVQATQADTAATVTNTTVTAADTAATTVDTVATTADTAATGVNTAVTTTNMAVEASSIPVKVASGAASQAKLPWPLNIIAIIATLGILGKILGVFEKGGVIDEKFARGGMVNGKSHAQGGEKFAVGGRVVELEGGEAVINKRSTAMYKDQLSAINQAGGGRKFADGGLLNMPKFTTARFGNTNQGTGAQKVYVVESDISSTQNSVSVIQAGATI